MTTSTESQPMLSFPDASTLDLIIPNSSDFDVESHLKSDDQLVSRDALFFEELLPVYLILRSSLPSFQEVIRNVELYITAYATQPSPPPRLQSGGAPAPPQQPVKLALDAVTITPEHKPSLVHLPEEGHQSYAVWKTTLYLRFPPQRLHRPSIHLTASAISKPAEVLESIVQDEYMISCAPPTSENLFQSLQHSSQNASSQPYLPSSRIHKVAPRAAPTTQEARPLRTSSKLFNISPALAIKVHITPEQVSDVLLCLDLESARHGGVQIDEIKAEGSSLTVEPFSADLAALSLPTTLQTGDKSTFLYKLARPKDTAGVPSHHSRPSSVTFQIRAVAQVSDTCSAQIQARWHGNVNFPPLQPSKSTPLRPQSVASTTQDLNSRPLSKRISTMTTRPMSGMTQIDSAGVTFAFTAPDKVKEGETFLLDVFVREAWMAEVVCLNADVRVGPLPPGACHNVQLEFLTLSSGLVGLAAVHVVDLDSRETTQITELPDIMVSE
ncbi:hypothetical protein KCU77_g5628, partial [Aureobasidium melanogenum]